MSEQCHSAFNEKHLCITVHGSCKTITSETKGWNASVPFQKPWHWHFQELHFQNQLSLTVLHCLHFQPCMTLGCGSPFLQLPIIWAAFWLYLSARSILKKLAKLFYFLAEWINPRERRFGERWEMEMAKFHKNNVCTVTCMCTLIGCWSKYSESHTTNNNFIKN